ncbi:hypothetical protein F2Q69_00006511 [Brassica cretica]|uniref:Uncharacterized protein n=1 Tax=Brassica cretica TaxID=69181 RepID=A0A8S9P1K1_BRACR|nr:hypothetical protein F2Q69_00006511 [Brassica cretica]
MVFFIGLRELHRSIKFPLSLEYDVGSLHGPSNFLVGSAQICTLDSDDFFSFMKMRRCPHGGDWSELADFSLHFLRLSSSMNRVEECMGQDPGIWEGESWRG